MAAFTITDSFNILYDAPQSYAVPVPADCIHLYGCTFKYIIYKGKKKNIGKIQCGNSELITIPRYFYLCNGDNSYLSDKVKYKTKAPKCLWSAEKTHYIHQYRKRSNLWLNACRYIRF